jgi:hypothetical protein
MIIFRRSGQLGNQIFQVAYALSIRSRNEIILMNDIDEFMSCFEPPAGLRNIRSAGHKGARRILDPFFLASLGSFIGVTSTIVETWSANDEIVTLSRSRGLIPIRFVKGGWFQDYSRILLIDKSFPTLRENVKNRARQWIGRNVDSTRKLVFCHVRRADYLNFQLMGLNFCLPLQYYLKALSMQLSENPDALILVASDDLEFVKLGFASFGGEYLPITEDAKVTFAIMSMCNAGVISNSSYSWWAGLMVARGGGRIIGPKNWLGWQRDRWAPPTIATPDFEWVTAL